jgi:hypothetical protein
MAEPGSVPPATFRGAFRLPISTDAPHIFNGRNLGRVPVAYQRRRAPDF